MGPQLMALFKSHGVNLVFDVGANTGQFAKSLREEGYIGHIVSFEPLAAAREQLLASSRRDSLWEVASRAAIGSEDGEIEVRVASNSTSSSVLNMLQSHVEVAPESRYIGTERVPLRKLDSFAQAYLRPNSVPFLKIDTQGYEDRVLSGATELLDKTIGVQLEMSLIPLYEGQCLFPEMIDGLKSKGFELWAIWQSFVDENNGRLLQVDGTFFRC
jgi:FkbM family methyltransferase